MNKKTTTPNVEDFLAQLSQPIQSELFLLCDFIVQEFPQVTQGISYAMPSFKLFGKPLCYFNVYKSHIGFYALPFTHKFFEEQLAVFKCGKGSVQFPIHKPIPLDLIKEMIRHRAKQIEKEVS